MAFKKLTSLETLQLQNNALGPRRGFGTGTLYNNHLAVNFGMDELDRSIWTSFFL